MDVICKSIISGRKINKMTPVKDEKTGKWQIQFWYKNSFGENKKTTKRGFSSKRDAID